MFPRVNSYSVPETLQTHTQKKVSQRGHHDAPNSPRAYRSLEMVEGCLRLGSLGLCPEHAGIGASPTLTPSLPPTDMISIRSGGGRPSSGPQMGTGRGTLRLRSRGPATVEDLVSVPARPQVPLPCEIHRWQHHLLAEELWALDANPPLSSRTFLGQVGCSFLKWGCGDNNIDTLRVKARMNCGFIYRKW